MLLETLDVKKDDIVIFSQNIFNLEKNFSIIYKDDPKKEIKKISYDGVCRFINEYNPKNLIVYRLLTNIKNFEIYISKYGYIINVNGNAELIYFDPVFAVKELEDYNEAINYYDLRFRIQQVGLTTLNRKGDLPNYAEIYSIDLEASEAKFQNDKIFAEAIFFDQKNVSKLSSEKPGQKKYNPTALKEIPTLQEKSEDEIIPPKKSVEPSTANVKSEIQKPAEAKEEKILSEVKDGIRIISHDIAEDKDFDYKQIMKINFKASKKLPEMVKVEKTNEEFLLKPKVEIEIPKLLTGKSKEQTTFGKFLQNKQKKTAGVSKSSINGESEVKSRLLDMFKSSASMNKVLQGKENRQVVLKLDKKL
ncbi:MAG: hypothetical protein ACYCVH_02090 [Ignavibacteriaceae bacterium]